MDVFIPEAYKEGNTVDFLLTDDEQVPKWTVQFFENAMKKDGNEFELHMFEGRKNYLGGDNPKYSRY